jgi:hypothetical protein
MMTSMKSSIDQLKHPFILHGVLPFLAAKMGCSRITNAGKPQRRMPEFGKASDFNGRMQQIYAISKYAAENLFYKSDPWYYDHYTHPLVLQEAVERVRTAVSLQEKLKNKPLTYQERQSIWMSITSEIGISCDCDDYAAWFDHALANTGMKNHGIYNLIVRDQIKDIQKNHVICLFELGTESSDKVSEPWLGCLDTNGLNWVSLKNGDANAQIRELFGRIYQTTYDWLIPVEMPFDELKQS